MTYRSILFFTIILIISSCSSVKIVQKDFVGIYEETNWSPMSQKYIFKEDGSFEHFYSDDTYGTYSRGNFSLKGKKLTLDYDELILDSLIVLNSLENPRGDSVSFNIKFKALGGYDYKIYENDLLIKSGRMRSNVLSEVIQKPNDKIKIELGMFADHLNIKEISYTAYIDLRNYTYCLAEYFPSNSWYEFNKYNDKVIRMRNMKVGYFEIHINKSEWHFKRNNVVQHHI